MHLQRCCLEYFLADTLIQNNLLLVMKFPLTESAFARSVRLRQIALQASQAAILESRIAKANRSRPQQLPVAEMTPGTTKVEIFRDDGGGYMDGVAQRRS